MYKRENDKIVIWRNVIVRGFVDWTKFKIKFKRKIVNTIYIFHDNTFKNVTKFKTSISFKKTQFVQHVTTKLSQHDICTFLPYQNMQDQLNKFTKLTKQTTHDA